MSDDPPGLFDAEPYQVTPAPALGADARRTLRQSDVLATGYHPVSRLKLHPDDPPVEDRQAPGPRCGDCAHLFHKPQADPRPTCAHGGRPAPRGSRPTPPQRHSAWRSRTIRWRHAHVCEPNTHVVDSVSRGQGKSPDRTTRESR